MKWIGPLVEVQREDMLLLAKAAQVVSDCTVNSKSFELDYTKNMSPLETVSFSCVLWYGSLSACA